MHQDLRAAYERDARNAFEVSQVLNSEGFKLLEAEMNSRLVDLDVIMNNTINPNEAFACIKEKIGILFFVDTAKDMIERGKAANHQLAVS